MKRASWILTVLLGMTGANEARAQFFFSNTVAVGPFGGSRSFVRIGPHRSFGFYSRWYFPTYYYPYAYYPYAYWGDPYWGEGIYYSNPTVVINPPAAAPRQAEGEAPKGKVIFLPRKDEVEEKAKPEPPLPGQEAGMFRPLQPEDRARALQPMPAEIPRLPEAARPSAEPPKEIPPVPVDLISRGKQALAAQEYGRAERLLHQATIKEPQAAPGYFLLAQAQFARAKYEEASQTIHAGLRLQPDWPKSDFHPEKLYGQHRADFQEQLDHLRQLVNRKPSDPVLLFLFAYQLWFAGRQEEAKPVFQRAKEITSDETGIDLFLQPR